MSIIFIWFLKILTNLQKPVALFLLPHSPGLKFLLTMFVLFLLTGRPFSLKREVNGKREIEQRMEMPSLYLLHWIISLKQVANAFLAMPLNPNTNCSGRSFMISSPDLTHLVFLTVFSEFYTLLLSILGYRSLFYLFDKSSSLTALHTAMLVSLRVSSLVPCSNHLWLYLTHFTYQTVSHPSFQSSESDIISTFPWIF